MCGIAGWLNLQSDPPNPEALERMLERIQHRGPDQRGRHQEPTLSLGMTRLAINDVEGGGQPYYSEDRRVICVFNGEIYNFQELKRGLLERGHSFRSNTDGEVIVHLWEELGPDFVHQLNGMFAIALWDGECLYLFRDRFGIKPLYYAQVNGALFFASELKSLVEAPGFSRELDHGALKLYLSLEYVPSPHSIFRVARKLRPGCWLKIRPEGEIQECRYYQLPIFTADGGGSLEEWAERLSSVLRKSVSRRLLSDVPLGVFLSGGLDSSSLTALMTECSPGQVKSFSVGFSEKTFDESDYASMVSERLGTEHHQLVLRPENALGVLDSLYGQLDEPLGDAAIIPTYLLAEFARQHVTVALAGEGADELLGGYPTYFAHQVADLLKWMPGPLVSLLQGGANLLPTSRRYMSWDFKVKRFCSGLGLPLVSRHLTWMGSIPEFRAGSFLQKPESGRFSWELGEQGTVEEIQRLDFGTYLGEDLLVKLDRATMMTSLEGRVPFLDHEVVETMASMPTAFKLRGLDAKRALKKAMEKSLPEPILQRPKKGFGIPIAEWLRGPLRPLLDEHLNAEYLCAQGLFRPEPVVQLVREHSAGSRDHRKPLWTLLVFQMWWKNYQPVL